MLKRLYSILFIALMCTCAQAEITFRGAWIATVANIDWPSKEAIGDTDKQQTDMLWILDSLQSIGINAIIFQVRPTSDALYHSELEPVSHWLTGTQGSWNKQTPWDPLAWTIEQAHQRNMEVHVWLNPYRVNLAKNDTSMLCKDHIMRRHPEWFWQYAKQWYFDPGLDQTREWICTIVQDIVDRYDIQAIHMDDYFYPYPVAGQDFPDAEAFAADPRGFDNVGDWRRDNVNLAIEQVHNTIMSIKPHVQFGISPFGIWRNIANDPRGSETNGLQNYDQLYADILLWMEKGWIDYVIPQLYWEIGKKVADYKTLAYWWAQHATDKCRVYIGMAPYHMGNPRMAAAWNEGNEICRQLRLNRSIPGITGECYFPSNVLLKNHHNLVDSLQQVFYPTYVSAPRK